MELRLDSGLVETIAAEAGEAEHALPLLEAALTHEAYYAAGRVAGAVGQRAEGTWSGLVTAGAEGAEHRSIAKRLSLRCFGISI